jgi:hypothetical protein
MGTGELKDRIACRWESSGARSRRGQRLAVRLFPLTVNFFSGMLCRYQFSPVSC